MYAESSKKCQVYFKRSDYPDKYIVSSKARRSRVVVKRPLKKTTTKPQFRPIRELQARKVGKARRGIVRDHRNRKPTRARPLIRIAKPKAPKGMEFNRYRKITSACRIFTFAPSSTWKKLKEAKAPTFYIPEFRRVTPIKINPIKIKKVPDCAKRDLLNSKFGGKVNMQKCAKTRFVTPFQKENSRCKQYAPFRVYLIPSVIASMNKKPKKTVVSKKPVGAPKKRAVRKTAKRRRASGTKQYVPVGRELLSIRNVSSPTVTQVKSAPRARVKR